MGSITSKNRGGKFLFCAVDVFTKYAWFKTLQDKKAKTVLNGFIKIVNESKRKLSTLWFNQGEKNHNNLMQKRLDDNDILIYSSHDEGQSVVAERFIRTLKGKIYIKMTANYSKLV